MSFQEGSSKPREKGKYICEWGQRSERNSSLPSYCFPESPTSLFVLLEEPEVRDLFDLNQENLVKNIQASERAAYISMII